MSRRSAVRAAIAVALCAAPPARAEIATFEFVGEVTTLTADAGLFGMPGTVQLGDPFSGRFSYELGPGNPDQAPADAEIGAYALDSLVIDQTVAPIDTLEGVGVRHEPPGVTLPPVPPDLGRDWFSAAARSESYPGLVRVQLRGPYESAFSDDSLPSELDLADFPDLVVVAGLVAVGIPPYPSKEDVGTITDLWRAPEPGATALGALAVITLALRARRLGAGSP